MKINLRYSNSTKHDWRYFSVKGGWGERGASYSNYNWILNQLNVPIIAILIGYELNYIC
jgi:hypothetical protein